MNFRTQIPISTSNHLIDYHSRVVSLGSCFAENIALKFDYFKFQNSVNPFGIIYNPVSIEKIIERVVQKNKFTEKDVFYHNDLWQCFEVHSEWSQPNQEAFLNTLNMLIDSTYLEIKEASHVVITYGTSWIYKSIASQSIVANCHKVPQKAFQKELLSIEIIEESIQNTIALIQSINPKVQFIFTISPVRHLKDGFVENQRSKAHLIAAIHQVLQVPPSGAEGAYFPSYEITMDELRDYRFYSEDMLHPNQIAIDYIWERFVQSHISEDAYSLMEEVSGIQKSLLHKPFNPESEIHQTFVKQLQQKINQIQKKYPFIQFNSWQPEKINPQKHK
jgi:hypothetical protein